MTDINSQNLEQTNPILDLKKHLMPMIKCPQKSASPAAYYRNFEGARKVLQHPQIMQTLLTCSAQQFRKAVTTNRRLLMTDETDLAAECYRGLLHKLNSEGMTCERFEDPQFQAHNWLLAVFTNQARDRLKYKVPSIPHYSIEASQEDETRHSIQAIANQYNALETLEQKEVGAIYSWFLTLELKVCNAHELNFSPARKLIWKLLYHPENIKNERDFDVNIQNARNPKQAFYLYQINRTRLIDTVKKDGERMTKSKNLVLWLLFGQDYESPERMLQQAPIEWIKSTRDNQIRRTENRCDCQIWKIILIGLLSNTCPQGYQNLYVSFIEYALDRAKNALPRSRKGKNQYRQTKTRIKQWAYQNVNHERKPSLTNFNTILAILFSDFHDGQHWKSKCTEIEHNQAYRTLRIAKKIVHRKHP